MNVDVNNKIIYFLLGIIQHYNGKKYWKYRNLLVDARNNKSKIKKIFYLLYIKRCDAYNCASFGTDLGKGAQFDSTPNLPHGIKGIIIHPSCKVGSNVTIYQHVTIGRKNDGGGVPVIGNNVTIGVGAAVLGEITIGDNVIIGANSVVINDVPDNSIAVGVPAVIKKGMRDA